MPSSSSFSSFSSFSSSFSSSSSSSSKPFILQNDRNAQMKTFEENIAILKIEKVREEAKPLPDFLQIEEYSKLIILLSNDLYQFQQ